MSDEISLLKGWTLEAYVAHNEQMRIGIAEAEKMRDRLMEERDRRYREVEEVKEKGKYDALKLAREIQTYKDEKANELREQIGRERFLYATKGDLTAATEKLEETIKPIASYVASQSGPRALTSSSIFAALAALGIVASLYFGTHRTTPVVTTPTVTVTTPTNPTPTP